MKTHHHHPTPPRQALPRRVAGPLLAALCLVGPASTWAQPAAATAAAPTAAPITTATAAAPAAAALPRPVVVSGTVPDEASRNAILARVAELYGADRVVDHLGVGPVVAPPNWTAYVQKVIAAPLRQVSRGELLINGNNLELRGEVARDDVRQKLATDISGVLNPTYVLRNNLRVSARDQSVVDAVLANRTVEFEPASSVLSPNGAKLLDEMVAALQKLGQKKVALVGHTDAQGPREANVQLSRARADAVRTYLVNKGIAPALISTSGMGPDQPLASNDTPDGRARNRRIDFRISD